MTEMLPERDAVVDVAFGPEDFGLWLVGGMNEISSSVLWLKRERECVCLVQECLCSLSSEQ